MFRKQLGHVDGSGTVIALWSCFLPGFVVESREDVDLLPFKVEARQFQGGHFADTQAAKGCDQAHELERLHGSVDDSRRSICIEEENLCLGRLVSGKLNVFPSDIGDDIAPPTVFRRLARRPTAVTKAWCMLRFNSCKGVSPSWGAM